MDDTMKEKKMGGKKHGMVLIISVGKKGDKDPMHAADPDSKKKGIRTRDDHYGKYGTADEASGQEDFREKLGADVDRYVGVKPIKDIREKHGDPYAGMTPEQADEFNRLLAMHNEFEKLNQPEPEAVQESVPAKTKEENLYDAIFNEMKAKALKKASIDDLFQEASSLRDAGDKATARQFSDVASAMQRAPALRQSLIDRFGTQATNALAMTHPEMASAEGMGEMMFQEGKNNPDYIEARSDPSYLGEGRKPFMSAISALARGKQRVNAQELAAQEALQRLIAEDPSRFFADRRVMGEQGE
tara:strand:- start:17540 stop:18442 length:903 start_codon:yes stop_codon:yes gene_type:complete